VLNHALSRPDTQDDEGASRSDPLRPSPVRYARTGDGLNIAYQVAGGGELDILSIPGYIHHLDIWWNAPTDRLVRALTDLGRLLVFDKRGIGLSDRPEQVGLEGWVRDALAVLDAAGSEQAVLLGVSGGSLTALQLAAHHPERVRALVIFDGFARQLAAPGYDIGHDPALVDAYARVLEAGWGTGVELSSAAPSLAADAKVKTYWARYQRLSASPTAAMRYLRATVDADVRAVLTDIRVPALVLHAERDVLVPVAQGRYLAEHIPGAQFVALDSDIHLICVSDVVAEVGEHIRTFLDRVQLPGRDGRPRASAAPD
jgi:pimeloyl-ACP methyl ester carboxylesterase